MAAIYLSSLNISCIPTQFVDTPGLVESFILDTADFRVAQFFTVVNCTDDTFTAVLSLEESQDPLFGTSNVVTNNFLTFSNTESNFAISATDRIVIKSFGYVGKKRYIRFQLDVFEVTNSLVSVFCILTKPLNIPFSYNQSIIPPVLTEYRVTNTGAFRITNTGDRRIVRLS